jgi:hypothetical protein
MVIAVALAFLVGGGCSRSKGGVKTVSGSVTLDGKALADAELRFVPKEDLALGEFGGRTGADGRFSIAVDGSRMVAHPGTYIVLVTKGQGVGFPAAPKTEEELKEAMKGTAPGLSGGVLPERYGDRNHSPFTAEIKEGNTELPTFALVSKP